VTRSFVLPYIPPGSNQLARMHWSRVADWRRQVRDDVTLLVSREPLIRRARVTYAFRWRTKTRHDPHNYVEALKPLMDALVGRWLVDDDQVTLEVHGVIGTGERDCVTVTVEDLDGRRAWTDSPDER